VVVALAQTVVVALKAATAATLYLDHTQPQVVGAEQPGMVVVVKLARVVQVVEQIKDLQLLVLVIHRQ